MNRINTIVLFLLANISCNTSDSLVAYSYFCEEYRSKNLLFDKQECNRINEKFQKCYLNLGKYINEIMPMVNRNMCQPDFVDVLTKIKNHENMSYIIEKLRYFPTSNSLTDDQFGTMPTITNYLTLSQDVFNIVVIIFSTIDKDVIDYILTFLCKLATTDIVNKNLLIKKIAKLDYYFVNDDYTANEVMGQIVNIIKELVNDVKDKILDNVDMLPFINNDSHKEKFQKLISDTFNIASVLITLKKLSFSGIDDS